MSINSLMGSKQTASQLSANAALTKVHLFWTVQHSSLHRKLSVNVIREVCAYLGGIKFLPCLFGNSLRLYDLANRQMEVVNISHNFTQGAVFCRIDDETMICVGGSPAQSEVFLLRLMDFQLVQMPQMLSPRGYSGILKHDRFVYVFGGFDGVSVLKSCEKFDLLRKSWARLLNMQHPRRSFSPCLYEEEVYLPDMSGEHRVLESFNLVTERFTTLPIRLPGKYLFSVSFVINEELVIVTRFEVYRQQLKPLDYFRAYELRSLSAAFSSCPPTVIGRKAYWVTSHTGELNVFDNDTNVISIH